LKEELESELSEEVGTDTTEILFLPDAELWKKIINAVD
jgi:hypothetical protein